MENNHDNPTKIAPPPGLGLGRAMPLLLAGLMATAPMGPAARAQEDEKAPQTEAKAAPKAADAPRKVQTVEVVANDTKIETAVAMINDQIDGKVNLYGKASGQRVTVMADSVPVEEALGMIANPNNLVWWREDNGRDYGIADREYYERVELVKKVVQKVFRPNNIKASELDRAIKGLLTPNLGSSVADDRTNKLIINDLPQALERIERFIKEIDVQLIVRVFYIRHADVEDIAKKIENYKSDPGTIEVDVKTHQIIVTDLLANIKKMELLIDILDVGPEIVIYDINNVGIEGADLEDLQKIIDSIRTEDLLFEVNEKQGVIILEDVPEVHERVEQILAEFDKPVRQVLIQSEILTTSFDRSLSYGIKNFAVGEDLAASVANPGTGVEVPGGSGSFDNFRDAFPVFSYAGGDKNLIGGRWLSSHAYLELEAAYKDSRTRVLLQPRLLVKNQETAEIFVGSDVPFLTTFRDNNGNDDEFVTTTQSTVSDGLKFEVTAAISNSYLIELELAIDNDDATPVEGSENTLVRKDRQNIKTVLQIPSGRTRLIGGLITDSSSDSSQGLPFLSSIPVIGALFGQKAQSKAASNLIIFLTPSVVEEDEVRQNEGGRRGRQVSSSAERIGQYDLQLGREESGDSAEVQDFLEGLDRGELLSGSEEDEEETLRRFREMREKRRAEQEETESNYTPSAGFGSTTLNSRGGAPGGRPQTRPPISPGSTGANPVGGVPRNPGSPPPNGGEPVTAISSEEPPPPPAQETNY